MCAAFFFTKERCIKYNYPFNTLNTGGAKPSNLRAKFENLAKSSEESNQARTAEQKKLREEKDRVDRETAAKKTVSESLCDD